MRHIALLRGVNVGGTGRLPMQAFRTLLAGLGLSNVQTYIQSGNAIFDSDLAPQDLSKLISDAIEAQFGFRRPVIMRHPAQLRTLLAEQPFQTEADDRLHFFFCSHDQSRLDPNLITPLLGPQEAWSIMGHDIALYAPSGIARSKLVDRLPKLVKGEVTARNLRTTRAVLALALTNP